ncbi:Clathrin assembly protein complex 2 beta large chain, variant 2 [Stylosanthes scabra]|uniref:Clathrin assembly protein complex 2 beta large chain, variant 2 n=1 Tax=Stylosanthes scabra TaxID=79078 RepID=A0ABU6SI09_9FABA|nr:Clathrin assembly protein complex 2 beta large chain, variant 2 [Stylosanthes scabra]
MIQTSSSYTHYPSSRGSNPNTHSYTLLCHFFASGPPTLGAAAISFRSSCRRRCLALIRRRAALLPTFGRTLRRLALLPSPVLLLQSPVVARSWPEVRVHRFVAPPPPRVVAGSPPPSWFIAVAPTSRVISVADWKLLCLDFFVVDGGNQLFQNFGSLLILLHNLGSRYNTLGTFTGRG